MRGFADPTCRQPGHLGEPARQRYGALADRSGFSRAHAVLAGEPTGVLVTADRRSN